MLLLLNQNVAIIWDLQLRLAFSKCDILIYLPNISSPFANSLQPDQVISSHVIIFFKNIVL